MKGLSFDIRLRRDYNKMTDLFQGPAICLAPLAGYSDAAFRFLCFEFGADFALTEMVSAEGLKRKSPKTLKLIEGIDKEGTVGVQLFGSDPSSMAEAAEVAATFSPAFIDLNFGCPVKKVVRKNGGAGLMRDLNLMGEIADRVVKRVAPLFVTAKIRSGWSRDEENYLEAGNVLQEAGVSAITLHPRYRAQAFSGEADWYHIAKLKEELNIPVIANGDVKSVEGYRKIVDITGCNIIMIGRGAVGRPWIFSEIKEEMNRILKENGKNRKLTASEENREMSGRKAPSGILEKMDILKRYTRMEVELKGERLAMFQMRKRYKSYIRDYPGMKDYRNRLSHSEKLEEVLSILDEIREEITGNE